jgi:hypothetical protein
MELPGGQLVSWAAVHRVGLLTSPHLINHPTRKPPRASRGAEILEDGASLVDDEHDCVVVGVDDHDVALAACDDVPIASHLGYTRHHRRAHRRRRGRRGRVPHALARRWGIDGASHQRCKRQGLPRHPTARAMGGSGPGRLHARTVGNVSGLPCGRSPGPPRREGHRPWCCGRKWLPRARRPRTVPTAMTTAVGAARCSPAPPRYTAASLVSCSSEITLPPPSARVHILCFRLQNVGA